MGTQRTECVRCGQCCLKSSPTLQQEDIILIEQGVITLKDLFTIRQGELAADPIKGGPVIIGKEIIKVREKENGGCVFYQEDRHSCAIYRNRPAQCAALKCWDTGDFMKVFSRPKAQRKGILKDPELLDLIEEHEKRCGFKRLEGLVKSIEKDGESAVEELIRLLRFDLALRPNAALAFKLDTGELDFVLGRPLIDTIAMFGLQVKKEHNGSFLLTSL